MLFITCDLQALERNRKKQEEMVRAQLGPHKKE
jgi:hypothetical protein